MHPDHLQSSVNTGWEVTQLRFWFSCLQLSHGICISKKDPKWCWCYWSLDQTLGSIGLEWTYLVCLRSLLRNCVVSAPQHFWNSFQGEPKPPRSPGRPGSLCHCPKAQENGSSGCPSLPDTTWGCGSGQGQQQEVDQREHAGDEQGCGQRFPKENIVVSLFSIDKIASCDFS